MLSHITATIEWIGGKGTLAVAVALLLALALPPLSAVMRPLLPAAVFVMLVLAFARVDGAAVAMRVRRPRHALLATAWLMLVTPVAVAMGLAFLAPTAMPPELAAAVVIMAAAPPIMSAPAFAYLLGLDVALSVTILVATLIATPLTAPFLAELFVGEWVALSAAELAIRLTLLLVGALAVALVLRRVIGERGIEARSRLIDGLNILMLFVFASAIMDGVVATALREPLFILGVLVLAFAVNVLLLIVTALAFMRMGIDGALTVGVASANRNMGLMAAAMVGAIPDVTWLYFALAQFPIYLMPQLTKPAIVALRFRYSAPRAPHGGAD